MANETTGPVADDFSDAAGFGKVAWLAIAALRFIVSFSVAALFLIGVLTLNSRFQADRALANNQTANLQTLAEVGGGAGVSQVADRKLMDSARAAEAEIKARQTLDAREEGHAKSLEAFATRLQALAVRAGCGAATVDEALRCQPAGTADATLQAEYKQTQDQYRAEHAALLATRAEGLQRAPTYAAKLYAPGGDLARVLPALDARDEIERSLPNLLKPAIDWFFGLPLLVSSVIVAFLAGMFGSVAVLLVLLAFPTYNPLTFGGGKYFFLRMFTGGFIAVIVFMVIQSGITFSGVGDLGAALGSISVADPIKIALIGMFAGAFSEQLAGAVHRYAAQFGGDAPASPITSAPAPAEEMGAVGPGALEEMNR